MKLHHSAYGIPREPGGLSDDAWRIERRDEMVIAAIADGLGAARKAAMPRAGPWTCSSIII